MVSETPEDTPVVSKVTVLILVLVEDGLGDTSKTINKINKLVVLILVLVEDGLGGGNSSSLVETPRGS